MIIKVRTKVGNVDYEFVVEEQDEMLGLNKAFNLGNPPNYCNECKNKEHFRMDSNKDKEGNTYVNVTCRKCGAKAKLGQYKTKGFFWHKFEKYIKPGNTEQQQEPEQQEDNSSGLPF